MPVLVAILSLAHDLGVTRIPLARIDVSLWFDVTRRLLRSP